MGRGGVLSRFARYKYTKGAALAREMTARADGKSAHEAFE
jgi:hypothetical protein